MEGEGRDSRPVLTQNHEAFRSRRSLTATERKELAIKQAAIRIIAGLETKSLRELAKEIGCSHTAIDNVVSRLCERLGLRKFHVSDETRQRLRSARARQEELRKLQTEQ